MRYYYKTHIPCHLCELPIPDWIGRTHHPLSGTIDHIIPRSMGGKDRGENRKPAHAYCNHHRGISEITDEIRAECRNLVIREFAALGKDPLKNIPDSKRYQVVRRLVRGFLIDRSA